ncbi:MAG TPA: four-carbon acid sugar kinase family protein [Anaerolineaceae bacterium]
MRLGVVADDLTGSNDIGIMFAKAGYLTEIYTFDPQNEASTRRMAGSQAAVMIVNTNARLLPAEQAYQRAFLATQMLKQLGCHQFYNKTCSVLRGPVGAYFDGMLDALAQNFALVIAGFPKNHRLTIHGIHYVGGLPLAESEFRDDPIHPMLRSNLVDILQGQTKRQVARVDCDVIRQGVDAVAAAIAGVRHNCNYLVMDVPDQGALRTIAQAAVGEPVFCGSSGLAEELAHIWGVQPHQQNGMCPPGSKGGGILVASGSLMPQSRAQIAWLKTQGIPVIEFDPVAILDETRLPVAVAQAVDRLALLVNAGRDVVFCMPNHPEIVTQIQVTAQQQGIARVTLGNRVSQILAEIIEKVVACTSLDRLIVAGGETSAAVCSRLGIFGFRLLQEIEPGLPSCQALSGREMILVLKSGSFGSPEFFGKAIQTLRKDEGKIVHRV